MDNQEEARNFLKEFEQLCRKYKVVPEVGYPLPLFKMIKVSHNGFPLKDLFNISFDANGNENWIYSGLWPG